MAQFLPRHRDALPEPRRAARPAAQHPVILSTSGLTPGELVRLQRTGGNAAASARVAVARPAASDHAPAGLDDRSVPARPPRVQRSLLGALGDLADGALTGIGSVASSVVGGARNLASSAASGVAHAATTALAGVTGIASDVLAGAKALGGGVLSWLKSAGSTAWAAVKWFGGKAWAVIAAVGRWGFEKLSLMGNLLWSFLSNLPIRLWRLVVDVWHGVTGILGWLWTGLKGAAGAGWAAISGAFSWIGGGLTGALRWLGRGLAGGARWAVDFVSAPTVAKLVDGLLGSLSWLGAGVSGLGRWGAHGLVAAAQWAWSGLKGMAGWLWDGAISGLEWAGTVLLHLLELLGAGELLQLLWGLMFRLRPLTGGERGASESVHPAGLIPYGQVRVDENSYLIKIGQRLATLFGTRTSPGAITTMHIIHAPAAMSDTLAVHELTHVGQYEQVGAIYMPQALHAQGSGGYDYGDLVAARAAGKTFAGFNREQQASICEDFYRVQQGGPAEYSGTAATLAPFIADMRGANF